MLVSGTADTYTDPGEVATTFSRLEGGAARFLVSLEGVNHYQAADCLDPECDNYEQDAPAQVPHETALERLGKSFLAFLSWKLGDDPGVLGELDTDEGITVERE